VGRPGWESSLLGDPGAKFLSDLPQNPSSGPTPLAGFDLTPVGRF
jgi:hypothetical protein